MRGVPKGYVAVAFDYPLPEELYVTDGGIVAVYCAEDPPKRRLIVERRKSPLEVPPGLFKDGWLAKDESGSTYWYSHKPFYERMCWEISDGNCAEFHPEENPLAFEFNWNESVPAKCIVRVTTEHGSVWENDDEKLEQTSKEAQSEEATEEQTFKSLHDIKEKHKSIVLSTMRSLGIDRSYISTDKVTAIISDTLDSLSASHPNYSHKTVENLFLDAVNKIAKVSR